MDGMSEQDYINRINILQHNAEISRAELSRQGAELARQTDVIRALQRERKNLRRRTKQARKVAVLLKSILKGD